VLGIVGANAIETEDGYELLDCAGEAVIGAGPRDHRARSARNVKAAAAANPSASNQPARELAFKFLRSTTRGFFFRFMALLRKTVFSF
jgi:hypothetical protein